MKLIIVLALVAAVAARPNDFYNERYNNFDVKGLIDNQRLLKAYTACFLDKGKCTPEGADFKKWMPEAVQTSCAKCTDKQKMLVATVIKAVMDKLAEDWTELAKVHNPGGKYDAELKTFLDTYSQ